MKKFTSLCLSSLVCLTTTAAQVTPLTPTAKTAKKAKTEAPRKSAAKGVKAPKALMSRVRQTTNGLTKAHSTARLNTGVLHKRHAKPSLFAPAEDSLFGFLAYSDFAQTENDLGYCAINAETGEYNIIFQQGEYTVSGAGAVDGKVYATGYSTFWGMLLGAYIVTYDAETGNVENTYEVNLDTGMNEVFLSAAFDAEELAFYGTTFNASQTGCVLAKYDVASSTFTYMGDTDDFTAMTVNQQTGALVGIELADDGSPMLFEIDRTTGATEPICEIEYTTGYAGGLCWSPSDNAYIWNPNTDDWAALVAISEDGSVEELCFLEGCAQFTSLICTETAALDPATPQAATLVGADFKDGSLSGNITWTMPTESLDGNALNGEINYTVYCDKDVMSEGTAQPGAEVTVDMTVTQGSHIFSLVPSVNGLEGRASKLSLYIGNDTPVAPAEVTLTDTTVEWSAVSTGVHSGYIETAAITYTVKLNGKVIAENISETSCPTGLPANTPLEAYVAEVTASCNGLTSEPTASNDLVYGDPLQLPVKLAPTPSEAKLFTITDNNEDGATWGLREMADDVYAFYYRYNSYNEGDDWLFLPPMEINTTEELISFQMKVRGENSMYAERYEVMMGTAPNADAMTISLIEPTVCDWTTPTIASAYTRVPEAGNYYIGIHCISEADRYYLYVSDFEVENTGITNEGPEKAENVTVKGGAEGALNATVTMTLPTKSINGSALSGEVTGIVTSEVAKAQVSGQPGETVSVEVPTVQGDNRLKVQTECNGKLGEIVYVNVFTGVDVPGYVTDMAAEVSADNLSAKVTWKAPTEGANGGYTEQTGLTYWLCQESIFGWSLYEELGIDVFEYEATVPAGAPQATRTVAIAAGHGTDVAVISFVDVVLGQPYQLPAVEKFEDALLTYGPATIITNEGTQYSWGVSDPAELGEEFACENGNAIIATSNGAGNSTLRMPKFTTVNCENTQLKFNLMSTMNDVTVTACGYGVEPKEIFRLSSVNHDISTYNTFAIDLPEEFQNNPWVYYEMNVISGEEGGVFMLASYSLRNMVDYDLAVTQLVGPKSAVIGEKAEYTAVVENYGLKPMAYQGGKFTVTTAEGKVVAEATVEADDMVDPDQKVQATCTFDINADMLGTLTVSFKLASSDLNVANDSASAVMTVKKGTAVVVTDLTAEVDPQDNNVVNLSWTTPSVPSGFASFEDETPFEMSSTSIGEFTNIDRDGADVYCWNGVSSDDPLLGNIAFKPGAFNVVNAPQLDEMFGGNGTITAKDGEQMLLAFCPVPISSGGQADKADDWLISPLVAAGSTFSFSVKPLTTNYGAEVIEVAYSTGSENPDDFEVLDVLYIDQEDWTDYEFTLPAEATRFALHYVSEDIFGIYIDAITFELANSGAVASYEVYLAVNGGAAEMIGTTSETKYTANINSADRNEFYVVPVLESGIKGEPSNKAVVVNSVGIGSVKNAKVIAGGKGEIVLSGFEAETVSVATLDGKVVATGNTATMNRISVEAGVYVVKAGKTVAKVIVK
ncbi:MAG: choice-of-anchor J domain-containing protein [Muribaculaceae bacterium]|nr:choice-of-anchor J domain-containing protein [Muribaculaceae bacterium]